MPKILVELKEEDYLTLDDAKQTLYTQRDDGNYALDLDIDSLHQSSYTQPLKRALTNTREELKLAKAKAKQMEALKLEQDSISKDQDDLDIEQQKQPTNQADSGGNKKLLDQLKLLNEQLTVKEGELNAVKQQTLQAEKNNALSDFYLKHKFDPAYRSLYQSLCNEAYDFKDGEIVISNPDEQYLSVEQHVSSLREKYPLIFKTDDVGITPTQQGKNEFDYSGADDWRNLLKHRRGT